MGPGKPQLAESGRAIVHPGEGHSRTQGGQYCHYGYSPLMRKDRKPPWFPPEVPIMIGSPPNSPFRDVMGTVVRSQTAICRKRDKETLFSIIPPGALAQMGRSGKAQKAEKKPGSRGDLFFHGRTNASSKLRGKVVDRC